MGYISKTIIALYIINHVRIINNNESRCGGACPHHLIIS